MGFVISVVGPVAAMHMRLVSVSVSAYRHGCTAFELEKKPIGIHCAFALMDRQEQPVFLQSE